MIEDTELREILRATAANSTLPAEMSQSMRRKVTRRRAKAIAITCLVSVGIAIGALQGMQAIALDDAAPVPPADETENKDPRAVNYSFLDVEVILHAPEPWAEYSAPDEPTGPSDSFWAGGPALVFDGNFEERLGLDADPHPIGTACQPSIAFQTFGSGDAEALAREIRSNDRRIKLGARIPDLEATAPVAVSVGGVDALRMDVTVASGADPCSKWGPGYPEAPMVLAQGGHSSGAVLEEGSRMRLYLLDTPWRSKSWSRRVFALWIVAPETRFEDVVEAAQPILDAIEFHAP